MCEIAHEGESMKSSDSHDLRLSLEECILASLSHRIIFNRVESLRNQKRILLCYDKRLLAHYNIVQKCSLRPIIIVNVIVKRLQKLAGYVTFAPFTNE